MQTQNLLDQLVAILRNAATEVPVWHLNERQRWALLRDILLGTAKIRGGQRPRDFPLDPDARAAIAFARDVGAKEISHIPKHFCRQLRPVAAGRRRTIKPIRFGAWLVPFAVMVNHAATQEAWPDQAMGQEPNPYRLVLWSALAILRRSLSLPLRDDDHTPETDAVLSALGANRQEFRGKSKMSGAVRDHIRHLCGLAMTAARMLEQPQEAWDCNASLVYDPVRWASHAGLTDPSIDLLRGIPCDLAFISTAKTQRYIAGAGEHRLSRGASAWCSQSLAFVRNILARQDGWMILADHDAVCCCVIPAGTHAEDITRIIHNSLSGEAGLGLLRNALPRLAPILDFHVAAGEAASACFPEYKISVLPGSLLDVCTPRPWDPSGDPAIRSNGMVSLRGVLRPNTTMPPVTEEVELTPPWWEPSLHGAERLNWRQCVWSMAGASYREHLLHSIHVELQKWRATAVHHGDMLRLLNRSDIALSLVKIDGDAIGRHFGTIAPLNRPRDGMELANIIHQRLMRAIRSVDAKLPADDDARPVGVDVQYLGGDEIMAFMPRDLVPEFLDGFANLPDDLHTAAAILSQEKTFPQAGNHKSTTYAEPTKPLAVRFTGVCLTLPKKPGSDIRRVLSTLAEVMISPALEVAKGRIHGDSQREKQGWADLGQQQVAPYSVGCRTGETWHRNALQVLELQVSIAILPQSKVRKP